MQNRRTDCETFGGVDNGVSVFAILAIELIDGAGLAEMLDPERLDTMPAHAAKPPKGRRVAVYHGDDAAVPWQRGQQLFDVTEMLHASAITAQPSSGEPAGMQTVDGGDRE